ncbi:hypothetical protein BS78_K111500 [Paspalum vaginatum]|uniref:Retrotransposon gag domain-containing protein n=1 Tax=Paspalum vaginatum TaxID=158149 RepID=A0A9W7X8P8_9POAL|nr:hypothetical protein BS78_K111500 [Paspalum vaginatum]
MGDAQMVTAQQFDDAISKLIDKMTEMNSRLTTVDNEVKTLCLDHGRLTVSVNAVQTQQLAMQGRFDEKKSGDVGPHPPPPPAATHKLRFPRYDGTEDPLGWLHKCEQFFRSQGTPEDQKVWVASFYMEGTTG